MKKERKESGKYSCPTLMYYDVKQPERVVRMKLNYLLRAELQKIQI